MSIIGRLKVIFILILSLLSFTSCTNQDSLSNGKIKSTENVINSTENTTLEFRINDEERGLKTTDFEQVYFLCKSFLEDAYNTNVTGKEIDLDMYISNNNLKRYVHEKINNERTGELFKSINFGLNQIEWNLSEDYVFLDIVIEVKYDYKDLDIEGGFSETHQFFISSENGNLRISDWYSPPKSTHIGQLDDISREYSRKICDPNVWENQEWVDGVFEKIGNIKQY